ncbi:MAG: Zn-dependent oligopeptidase [Bacteroidales bacterium]|nr:Zn-dependent oligopeptidase [Bacteroidales bacterium]
MKKLNHLFVALLVLTGLVSCNKMDKEMRNPFFYNLNEVIDFRSITTDHVIKATAKSIEEGKIDLDKIYAIKDNERTFENTVRALDDIYNNLLKVNEIISLLAYVHPEDAIRDECLKSIGTLGKFFNEISLNESLYKSIKSYSELNKKENLRLFEKKYLKETIEEFERNGFALSKEKRARLKEIQDRLSDLGIQFDSNISSYQDSLIVTETEIDGLPEDYKKSHKQADGRYKIGLEYPSYVPFMKYSKSDKAREELTKKYKNTASDKNIEVLKQILIERENLAKLLGYKTFAEYRTENRMAKTPKNVWDFENTLKDKVREKAVRDYNELLKIKQMYLKDNSVKNIESWEASFYNNILLKEKYELDNQKLKEYFEVGNVIDGLFKISQHLYGVKFEKVENPSVWSDDVTFYEVKENDKLIARFYLDLYPRENKYNHAACFGMIPGKKLGDVYQIPTASLVCNFPKATSDMPALMPHGDVETFFHEFGHLMHALLTKAELVSQSGTNVARDFVEMPSQIFENWAWDYDALSLFAKHYKTGQTLPKDLHEKMLAAKNVGSGLHVLQQIFYGSLDMTLHDKYDPKGGKTTTELVKELQNEITMFKFQDGTHFEAGFGHLNGYAAGYYSYLWALVFADDMFSVFEKNGVMNQEIGNKLRKVVLERGSTVDEMKIVEEFLDRKPNQTAFLKSIGL